MHPRLFWVNFSQFPTLMYLIKEQLQCECKQILFVHKTMKREAMWVVNNRRHPAPVPEDEFCLEANT